MRRSDAQFEHVEEDQRSLRQGVCDGDKVSLQLAHAGLSTARVIRRDLEATLWLIPTAEVPLTNLVREKITDEAELPIRVTAYTPCFRAEAGAAGKDTRGMIRQHQFSKVELVSITTPEQSRAEHERMTACAEEVLKRLGLGLSHHAAVHGRHGLCRAEDLRHRGVAAGAGHLSRDLLVLGVRRLPGAAHECALPAEGRQGHAFVHTLNGSGLAVGRTLVAILENYQQADGSVAIPDALVPYMGGMTRIEAA